MATRELAREMLQAYRAIQEAESTADVLECLSKAQECLQKVQELPESERNLTRQELMDMAGEEGLLNHLKN